MRPRVSEFISHVTLSFTMWQVCLIPNRPIADTMLIQDKVLSNQILLYEITLHISHNTDTSSYDTFLFARTRRVKRMSQWSNRYHILRLSDYGDKWKSHLTKLPLEFNLPLPRDYHAFLVQLKFVKRYCTHRYLASISSIHTQPQIHAALCDQQDLCQLYSYIYCSGPFFFALNANFAQTTMNVQDLWASFCKSSWLPDLSS